MAVIGYTPPPPPPAPKPKVSASPAPRPPPSAISTVARPIDTFIADPPRRPVVLNPNLPDGNVGVSGKGSIDVNGTEVGFKYGGGVFKTTDTTVEPDDEPGANGNSIISINTQAGFQVSGGVDGKGVGIDGSYAHGVEFKYQAVVTPAQLKAIRNGAPPPSPFNPDAMPAGTSITIKSGSFTNTGLGVSYKGASIDSEYQVHKDEAASVKKLPGNQVQISIGPETEIDAEDKFGVSGFGVSATFGTEGQSTTENLRQVTLDLNNPASRALYAKFLQTGSIPTENSPAAGVSGAVRISGLESDYKQTFNVAFGPFHVGTESPDSKYSGLTYHYPDGTSKMVVEQSDGADHSTWTVTRDANGQFTGANMDFHIDDVDNAPGWSQGLGLPQSDHGSLDVHLDQQTLADYQDRANDILSKLDPASAEYFRSEMQPLLDAKGVNDVYSQLANTPDAFSSKLASAFLLLQHNAKDFGLPPLPNPFTFTPS